MESIVLYASGSLSKSKLYTIKEVGQLPKIDDILFKVFPEHVNYKGDAIIHYHVDFGSYAISAPGRAHVASGGVWHTNEGCNYVVNNK